MINLDRAAQTSVFPGIENVIIESLRLHRASEFGLGKVTDSLLDEKVSSIARMLRFYSDQLSFFNSASAAVAFLSSVAKDKLYCHVLEHKNTRAVANMVEFSSVELLTEDDYFVVSLRNNETGQELSESEVQILKNAKCKLVFDITGFDFESELLDMADIVFASSGKWHSMSGVGLFASRIELAERADRFSGYALGTPNLTGVLSLEAAMRWMKKTKFRQEMTEEYVELITQMTTDLGWATHGIGKSICSFNVGVNGRAFCYECSELGLTISTGAACSSGSPENPVIRHLFGQKASEQTIRISWDRMTKKEDVLSAIKIMRCVDAKFKGM